MAKKQTKPAAAAKPAGKAVKKAQQAEVKASKKKPVAKVRLTTQLSQPFRHDVVLCAPIYRPPPRSRHELVKVGNAPRIVRRYTPAAHRCICPASYCAWQVESSSEEDESDDEDVPVAAPAANGKKVSIC